MDANSAERSETTFAIDRAYFAERIGRLNRSGHEWDAFWRLDGGLSTAAQELGDRLRPLKAVLDAVDQVCGDNCLRGFPIVETCEAWGIKVEPTPIPEGSFVLDVVIKASMVAALWLVIKAAFESEGLPMSGVFDAREDGDECRDE